MKSLLLSSSIAAFFPMAAMAETASPVNWAGFYGGISVSKFGGDWTMFDGGGIRVQGDMNSKTAAGIFGGYNWQKGNWVLGAELAYSDPGQTAPAGLPGFSFQDVMDVKARVGYATGKAHFYGVVGRSWSEFSRPGFVFDQSGMNYGVGVDYALGKHTVLGLEYLKRDLKSGEVTVGGGFRIIENDSDSLSARIIWKF